uniref:Uncharacterized protein n=1 Tax=Arundo donax TaxID=35708 RepID=A0A0A9DR11_ARUDO
MLLSTGIGYRVFKDEILGNSRFIGIVTVKVYILWLVGHSPEIYGCMI